MDIKRNGSEPSGKGPSEYFTGKVRVDRLFNTPDPARVAGASVTFEPGARTAWHTHPLGQTLIITAGCGWVQREGGPVEEIRPGDVVWFSPGEKHWHGATPTTAMTHIAIQEALDGIAAALPYMKQQKVGHVINVSSVAGHKVGPGFAVYAATKHAVRALSEGLRQEVKPYNIRTTVISPGVVATELPKSTTEPDTAERVRKAYEIAIPADLFARAVVFAISQPDDVDVNEILFRPTRQEY